MRRQGQIAGAAGNLTDWKNKPGILGDYIDHQKVNLLAGIEPLGEAANVGAPSPVSSGFNLYPQQLSVVFDDEIVAATISPRLADGEALLGGAGHEAQFRPFATLLVRIYACPFIFHE